MMSDPLVAESLTSWPARPSKDEEGHNNMPLFPHRIIHKGGLLQPTGIVIAELPPGRRTIWSRKSKYHIWLPYLVVAVPYQRSKWHYQCAGFRIAVSKTPVDLNSIIYHPGLPSVDRTTFSVCLGTGAPSKQFWLTNLIRNSVAGCFSTPFDGDWVINLTDWARQSRREEQPDMGWDSLFNMRVKDLLPKKQPPE